MYHDYFDDTDTALRNPYGPEVALPDDRGSHRQRLRLIGMVGAGLSVVAPAVVRSAAPAFPDQVAAADRTGTDSAPDA